MTQTPHVKTHKRERESIFQSGVQASRFAFCETDVGSTEGLERTPTCTEQGFFSWGHGPCGKTNFPLSGKFAVIFALSASDIRLRRVILLRSKQIISPDRFQCLSGIFSKLCKRVSVVSTIIHHTNLLGVVFL